MTELLRLKFINSLPQPFSVRLFGGEEVWPVAAIDVENGLVRIDVCGKLHIVHIGGVAEFFDSGSASHDPETFYSDYAT